MQHLLKRNKRIYIILSLKCSDKWYYFAVLMRYSYCNGAGVVQRV